MPVARETSEVSPAKLRREAAARRRAEAQRRKEARDRAAALRELKRIERQVDRDLPRGLTKEDRPSRLRTGATFTGQADVGLERNLPVGTTKKTKKKRSEMPGASLRTPEARRFREEVASHSEGLLPDLYRNVLAKTPAFAEESVDLLTGIPSFIRDPSLANAGWVAANVTPLGVISRPAKVGMAAARAARAGDDVGEITRASIRNRGRGSRYVRLGDSSIQFYSSPSVVTRFGQRLLDDASERLTGAVNTLRGSESKIAQKTGAALTPLSSRGRVPKQAAKRLRKEQDRAKAARSGEIELIRDIGGGSTRVGRQVERPERTAFFYEAQLPDELKGGQGLRLVKEDLENQLRSLTPEQIARDPQLPVRLQNEVKKLDKAIRSGRKYDERALDAARALNDDRLDILVRAGRLSPETAAERTTLLSRRMEGTDVKSLQADLAREQKKLSEMSDAPAGPSRERIATLTRQYEDALMAGDEARMATIERQLRAESGKGKSVVEPVNVAMQRARLQEQQQLVADIQSRIDESLANRGEIYVGHREGPVRGGNRMGPGGMSTSGTIGKTRAPQGTTGQNTLGLYRQGRLRTDPDVIVEDWQAAQSYEFNNMAKDELAKMGEQIDPTLGVKEGYVLVNPMGHQIPRSWRTQQSDLLPGEGFTGQDLKSDIAEYVENWIPQNATNVRNAIEQSAAGNPLYRDIRQVPEDVVNRYFSQLVDPRVLKTHPVVGVARAAGKTADFANDLVYMSLIYSNPGYIPANAIGNLAFNVVHQGVFAPVNLARAGQLLAKGPKTLRRQVLGEMGQGPTTSAASSFLKKPARMVARVPDDFPRVSAFLHEAANAGVIPKAKPLLTAKDYQKLEGLFRPQNRAVLNDVSGRAVEAMVNFERLGPLEKSIAKRFLFVYPWIKGATVYPFRFAADHPLRSAAMAGGAYAYTQREGDPFMDDMPPWLQGAVETPDWFPGGGPVTIGGKTFPRILNTGPISPMSTAIESWKSLIGAPGSRTASEFLNPGIRALINAGDKKSPYGRDVGSYGAALGQNLERLAPNFGLAQDLISPEGGGIYPEDETRTGRLKRAARVLPYVVDPEEARDAAVREGVVEDNTPPEPPKYAKVYQWATVEGNLPNATPEARADIDLWKRGQDLYNYGRVTVARQIGLENKDGTPSVGRVEANRRIQYALRAGVLDTIRPGYLRDDWRAYHKKLYESKNKDAIEEWEDGIRAALSFSDKYGRSLESQLKELMEAPVG